MLNHYNTLQMSSMTSFLVLFPPQRLAFRANFWSLLGPSPPFAPWLRLRPGFPAITRWRLERAWCRSPGPRSSRTAARTKSSLPTSQTAKQVHQRYAVLSKLKCHTAAFLPFAPNYINGLLSKICSFIRHSVTTWGKNPAAAWLQLEENPVNHLKLEIQAKC